MTKELSKITLTAISKRHGQGRSWLKCLISMTVIIGRGICVSFVTYVSFVIYVTFIFPLFSMTIEHGHLYCIFVVMYESTICVLVFRGLIMQ